MSEADTVAGGIVSVVLGVIFLAVTFVRAHLPHALRPGDISEYLQHVAVLRALLRPLRTRGRITTAGLTESPVPHHRTGAAPPEGDSQATTGSAADADRTPSGSADPVPTSAAPGRGVAPVGPSSDPARVNHSGGNVQLPVAACFDAAALGNPVSFVPPPRCTDGAGSKLPASPSGRNATPKRRVVDVGRTVALLAATDAHGRGGTQTPDSAPVRGSAVAGDTRALGDGPHTADAIGASVATPSDSFTSPRRRGGPSLLAFLLGIEHPSWLHPRGLVGDRLLPTATPAGPVEQAERSAKRSALPGSRRRGGPQALAEVPLPHQRADLGGSAVTVPPGHARAGRPNAPAVGE